MLQQHTIREPVRFSGIGLHGGERVNMAFLPAAPNSGIRFRRVDLQGGPEIEAGLENVAETTRSTTLARGNVKVQTVEHVLAAFAGMGVDNAVVELDAPEPPIADGSAREYTRMLEQAGAVPQGEPSEPFVVTEPIELVTGETVMSVFPHDRLRITCTSADKLGRYTQFHSAELSRDYWMREISAARTFCFFEELEYLFKNGLIRGGSLENAVVIRDDAVLTNEPLRYPNEFVRHKILDIMGDLYLLGRPFQGHIVAVKPSHAANCELARQLVARQRKLDAAMQAFTPPPPPPAAAKDSEPTTGKVADGTTLDIEQILKTLPHRYPMLLVDRITRIEGNKITGIKNVTANEPFFQGHFPGHPIMPGVLQLEAMAQVAGILMLRQADNVRRLAYFMSAEEVKWRSPVRPGDVLTIEIEMLRARSKIGKAKGQCLVDGQVVSEALVTFMLIES